MSDELDRGDWRFLNNLNFGNILPKQIPTNSVVKLEQRGLVDRNEKGRVVITIHGQLALRRRRYRNLTKQRYAIISNEPRKSIWSKLRRQ